MIAISNLNTSYEGQTIANAVVSAVGPGEELMVYSFRPTHVIVDITVHDADRYKDYVSAAPAFVARHEGKYLVRGGDTDVMEGDWKPERLVETV